MSNDTSLSAHVRRHAPPTPDRRRLEATTVHGQLDRDEELEPLGYTLLGLSAVQGERASCSELARCVRAPGRPRKRTRPASRRELERLLYRQRRLMDRARRTGLARGEARHLPA